MISSEIGVDAAYVHIVDGKVDRTPLRIEGWFRQNDFCENTGERGNRLIGFGLSPMIKSAPSRHVCRTNLRPPATKACIFRIDRLP